MKITISLLVLFVLVLGGGYTYNKRTTEKAMEESDANEVASTTDSNGAAMPALAPATGGSDGTSGSGAPANSGSEGSTAGGYTLAQVGTHATVGNCWTAINGNVYNLTDWIAEHPGGEARIIAICGKDGSKAFGGKHGGDQKAQAALANFKIGILSS